MTTKYTPGPLVVLDDPANGCWHVINTNHLSHTPVGKDVGTGPFEARDVAVACVFTSEADARLIAAAPEMYEALPDLSHVISWLQNGCDPIKAANELQAYQERIGRAKAKAEGRE